MIIPVALQMLKGIRGLGALSDVPHEKLVTCLLEGVADRMCRLLIETLNAPEVDIL